jgi:cytochrome c-type biogenesis protein CcmH
MTLWIILTVMTSATAVLLSAPFVRRLDQPQAESAGDIEVYRDQLKEVESEQRQGLIDDAQAKAARLEIERRALAADKAEQRVMPPLSGSERRFAVICVTGIVVLGSVGLYAATGNPDLPSTRGPGAVQPASASITRDPSTPKNIAAAMETLAAVGQGTSEDQGQPQPQSGLPPVDEMIERLAARLQQNPKDGQGWRTLGWSYFNIGRFSEAGEAYAKAIELNPNVAEIRIARIEALVRSADGIVTAEAKNAIEQTLKIDPKDPRARFFRGLAKEQGGDKTSALTDWKEVLRDANPDEPWMPELKNKITALERDLGVDAAGPTEPKAAIADGSPETLREPGASLMPPSVGKRPSPQDVRTAEAMPPADRAAMIEGMVARLAERLKKDGSDVPGWIQLVRSYRVLGNTEKVKAAVADAHAALASDQEALQRLDQGLAALETEAATPSVSGSVAAGPASSTVAIAPPGPNASQVAAAAQMAPAERNGMIEGMVARLAQRMAENGSDVDGWLRLIKAYTVLGDRGKALAAAANARTALAGNSDNLRRIGELAKELGLEGS